MSLLIIEEFKKNDKLIMVILLFILFQNTLFEVSKNKWSNKHAFST